MIFILLMIIFAYDLFITIKLSLCYYFYAYYSLTNYLEYILKKQVSMGLEPTIIGSKVLRLIQFGHETL